MTAEALKERLIEELEKLPEDRLREILALQEAVLLSNSGIDGEAG